MRFKKQLLIAAAVLSLGLYVFVRGCQAGRKTAPSSNSPATLPQDVREQIRVSLPNNQVTVQTHQSTKTLTGVRHATIDIKTNGEISVVAPTHGITFEPGLAGFYANRQGYIGPDCVVFYWNRFDLLGGLGINPSSRPFGVGELAIGWNPPVSFLSNTDVFIGYSTLSTMVIGIRVEF